MRGPFNSQLQFIHLTLILVCWMYHNLFSVCLPKAMKLFLEGTIQNTELGSWFLCHSLYPTLTTLQKASPSSSIFIGHMFMSLWHGDPQMNIWKVHISLHVMLNLCCQPGWNNRCLWYWYSILLDACWGDFNRQLACRWAN